jgi:hypothetical protein
MFTIHREVHYSLYSLNFITSQHNRKSELTNLFANLPHRILQKQQAIYEQHNTVASPHNHWYNGNAINSVTSNHKQYKNNESRTKCLCGRFILLETVKHTQAFK